MRGQLIRVRGLVQGVGFRPHVWRLAHELGLRGSVRNDGGGVSIAVAGEKLPEFIRRLSADKPPLARIDQVEVMPGEVDGDGFVILASASGEVATAIGPDAALCPACIADICNPQERRWRYAFTTCTHCGPRYTVSRRMPYDRAQTSLADFPLCAACAAEYHGQAQAAELDRRFHAETTCCPACGPQLRLLDAAGAVLDVDPLAETLAMLQAGRIVAIKGLGGFHLVCDARRADVVAELRRRKQREAKPFAVMGLNPASLAAFARIGPAEEGLLRAQAGPVVLCPKTGAELSGVAPGLAWLGLMLPATPLHLLLWHEAAGRPAGTDWLRETSALLLVMTSANPQGEPLVVGNDEALERLSGIADAFLVHDRDIVVRCDDSVLRMAAAGPRFIRRARGYVPLPIALAEDGPVVLALGGHMKNTICVMKGREAFLSQHVGSLDNVATLAFLKETVTHLLAILDVRPDVIAHDLHPDFPSTRLALELAGEWGIPAYPVAHHQAHVGAICAEHALNGPTIGLAIDGLGVGPDGGLWGGELLRLDGARCTRLGHLKPLMLPGGERAAREPWRMAVSALHAAGLASSVPDWLARCYPGRDAGPLLAMLDRQLRCTPSSSLGRLFDAVAGLLGLRAETDYEGQAAMELESLALRHGPLAALADGFAISNGVLDFTPLLVALLDCRDPPQGAVLFHATLAAGLAQWLAGELAGAAPPSVVVGGGCAVNVVLLDALRRTLAERGIAVLEAIQAPPNDGGLALGQAWVARQLFKENMCTT